MWPFNRKSLVSEGVFKGYTDYHTHIVPGVDDGMATVEESLAALDFFGTLGFKKVWCTPHIMEDYPNTTEHLRERFEELRAAYHGSIELSLSSENMLDNLFVERLEKRDLLPFGLDGEHLLVETSCFNPPQGMMAILGKIRAAGYVPVLAHPERYVYMDETDYRELVSSGVLFQVSLPSFTGVYGSTAMKKAIWMHRQHLVSFTGTDIHSLDHFRKVTTAKINVEELHSSSFANAKQP